MRYAVLTHGGAASAARNADGCVAAAARAQAVLEAGGDALAAALAATVALEDDTRFHAGTGSNLRLDGLTIEMDAAAMTSDARFGAVLCLQAVKNPVLVAARVMETPHLMLAGKGALDFARHLGFEEHDPMTEGARERYARAIARLPARADGDFALFRRLGVEPYLRPRDEPREGDTVGAVVRDAEGHFAATASTGGTMYMLPGRVGDSPLMGAGLYAGPEGAVSATGVGEEIVRRLLAKTVYDWLAEGVAPSRAAQRGVAMFPDVVDIGLVVLGRRGQAIASNRDMAAAQILG